MRELDAELLDPGSKLRGRLIVLKGATESLELIDELVGVPLVRLVLLEDGLSSVPEGRRAAVGTLRSDVCENERTRECASNSATVELMTDSLGP